MTNLESLSQDYDLIEKVTSLVVSNKTNKEKLGTILTIIYNYFECQSCGVLLYDQEKQRYHITGSRGLSYTFLKQFEKTPHNPKLLNKVLYSQKNFLLPNEGEYSHLNDLKFEHNYSMMLCKPLVFGDTQFGLSFITHKDKKFSKNDIRLFNILADLASTSLYSLYIRKGFKKYLRESLLMDKDTQLYNYAVFHNVIQRELTRAQKLNHQLSVLLVNIDHRRKYISINGEEKGKQMVRDVANLIRSQIRSFDLAALYHEENPVIILPELDKNGAIHIAQNIQNIIRNHKFKSNDPPIRLTIAAASYPEDAISENQLLSSLEEALYQGKRKGGDTIQSVKKQ